MTLTWVAEIGQTYDVYSAPLMTTSPSWTWLGSVTADSNPETYVDTPVREERYYTVEVQGTGVYSPTRAGTMPCTVVAKAAGETWQLSILGVSAR